MKVHSPLSTVDCCLWTLLNRKLQSEHLLKQLFIDFFVPHFERNGKGEVSEWSNEHAWKVCILERVSRVRIPPSPQEAQAMSGLFYF